ncbi:MAG: LytTR family DNA-binding domain-containing protein [Bacteroidota bacterium]
MTYKCVIVDDEDLARELIENHLAQLPEFELLASCASALEARKVLQEHQVHLLFLDIEMPLLKGTDFFKHLLHKPSVIFTTAYRDYAIEGFELNAVDYLLKPITFTRFFKATEKFLSQQQVIPAPGHEVSPSTAKRAFIFIRKDRKQVKLYLDTVLYIESLKDYIRIHLANEKHTIKYSITAFLELLDDRFLRTHRSFIINVDKITAFTKHDVEIGAIEVPIGESYAASVRRRLNG